jgi:hypothetical protein
MYPVTTELSGWRLRNTYRGWRYNDLDSSCCHVVDEAGEEPRIRQPWDRPQQRDIGRNRSARIRNRFGLELNFRYSKILRQHGRVVRKASDAAIGVLKNDEVELSAASRNLAGNFTDSPK